MILLCHVYSNYEKPTDIYLWINRYVYEHIYVYLNLMWLFYCNCEVADSSVLTWFFTNETQTHETQPHTERYVYERIDKNIILSYVPPRTLQNKILLNDIRITQTCSIDDTSWLRDAHPLSFAWVRTYARVRCAQSYTQSMSDTDDYSCNSLRLAIFFASFFLLYVRRQFDDIIKQYKILQHSVAIRLNQISVWPRIARQWAT